MVSKRLLVTIFAIIISISVCSGFDNDNEANKFSHGKARIFAFNRVRLVEETPSTTLSVFDFGAKGNRNDDTKAFEDAWKEVCSYEGPVTLEVPTGNYLVKPIRFDGPCKSENITFQIHGTIEGSGQMSDYTDKHWILFHGVRGLTVEGGGTLDGKGDAWWRNSCKLKKSKPCRTISPTALTFNKCEDLIVRHMRVRYSPQMQVAFESCRNVTASNLRVIAPGKAPNTDGIHVTHTDNIRISDSIIATGDDCISIVSGSSGVPISGITCGPGHGISIGSLGRDNAEAHVSDVTVDGAKFSGTTNGVRIKTWQGGSGNVSNVKFMNIEMNNVQNPIFIDQNYCVRDNCPKDKSAVQINDILYRNISGTSASDVAINLNCSPTFECRGIVLQDIDLRYNPGTHHHRHHDNGEARASCNNVHFSNVGVVTPPCPNSPTPTPSPPPPPAPVPPPPPPPVPPPSPPSPVPPPPPPPPSPPSPPPSPVHDTNVFNVEQFGAKGDGKDDTEAFNKAWNEVCSSDVEAFLVVPNKNYVVKPITFRGPCKSPITFQIHGTIEANTDRSEYFTGHWLWFDYVNDIVVEGGGTLNGNGNTWWCKKVPCTGAPRALGFHHCENVTMSNIKIKDAAQMHLVFVHCNNVRADGITITAPGNSPNTNGIHVSHSKDAHISNSVIGTGDDCISIVSETENVRATNITCGPGHGISIGALGRDSQVSDVVVDNSKFTGSQFGARIKTWQGGSGYARNIKFTNIEMHNVRSPILIDQNYCPQKNCEKQADAVQVSDVLYQNIKGTSSGDVAIKFDCSDSHKCEGIVLKDIELRREKGHGVKAFCKNVNFSNTTDVTPHCP